MPMNLRSIIGERNPPSGSAAVVWQGLAKSLPDLPLLTIMQSSQWALTAGSSWSFAILTRALLWFESLKH